ncbi:phage regulatory CII family protein [Marinomonas aquiplantarum]|uniref:Phage regulatory protein CII n=1 Tax=Marinomonas aquiplantarum TaxID=491951 RepID=A0A366D0I3_9GAMM|nr:phage regulatory CII family protein [Marinomonas aquiplantarum]RBO83405.1 phage regulatory protein CII [Marinomonas aquiplantarum]
MDYFQQSLHDLVHQSNQSSKDISAALGMSHQVLINKVNPNNTVNKLTVHELHAIQLLTGNDVVLRAMQGSIILSALKDAPCSIVEAVVSNGKECGDVFSAVQEAMADNRLTERERSKILKEIREAIASLQRTELAVLAHGQV